MSWRWDKPDDLETVAKKQKTKRYEKGIESLLEAAANDESVDFDALVTKVNAKAQEKKVKAEEVRKDAAEEVVTVPVEPTPPTPPKEKDEK